jgi:hypothetical protein
MVIIKSAVVKRERGVDSLYVGQIGEWFAFAYSQSADEGSYRVLQSDGIASLHRCRCVKVRGMAEMSLLVRDKAVMIFEELIDQKTIDRDQTQGGQSAKMRI